MHTYLHVCNMYDVVYLQAIVFDGEAEAYTAIMDGKVLSADTLHINIVDYACHMVLLLFR